MKESQLKIGSKIRSKANGNMYYVESKRKGRYQISDFGDTDYQDLYFEGINSGFTFVR